MLTPLVNIFQIKPENQANIIDLDTNLQYRDVSYPCLQK